MPMYSTTTLAMPTTPQATPAPDTPSAKYLDTSLGMELVGDELALGELLDLAEQSLARDLPAIDQCLNQGDVRSANAMLHAIKGFIPIFCTLELADAVTQVEGLGKTANATELATAYADLAPRLHQLLAEIVVYRQARAR